MSVLVQNFTRVKIPAGKIRRIVRKSANFLALDGDIEVICVESNAIRKLNRAFRNKNSSTTVLTFPYKDEKAEFVAGGVRFLGQIFVSMTDVVCEGKSLGLTFSEELTRILIHAIVHIAGYGHETARKEKQMKRIESKTLKGLT